MRIVANASWGLLATAYRKPGFWLDVVSLGLVAGGTALGGVIPAICAAAAGFVLTVRLADRHVSACNRGAVEELSRQNAYVTTALDHMSQGLCMFDASKRLIVSNAQYARMYGIAPEFVRPGTHFRQVLQNRVDTGCFMVGDPEDYIEERIAAVEEEVASVKVQHLIDGRSIAISHRPLPEGGWVATHDDITEIRRIESQIAHMAHHDGLTDLPNRVYFRKELDRALKRARLGEQLWVLCIDLDHFKPVNDTLGHPVGDILLQAVAGRLREETRGCDIVARLGGDEFAVLQGGVRNAAKAKVLAERLIGRLSEPYDIDGHHLVVGASVGIAIAPSDSLDADQLIKLADMALYRAKTEGGGAYCFFEPEMDAKVQARRALELDLRKALSENQFEVHYQPIMDIAAGRVSGFEALLRWRHPLRGNVSPAEFVPLAEEIGLIGEIGAWVLRTACAEATTWPEDVRLAVNLSPAQFRSRELPVDVFVALTQSGLSSTRLELEITETVILQDTGPTLAMLHSLSDMGVSISLDDFGTGYSSLSLLRRFPFDKIKIDRSFVQGLPDNADSLAIVKAVLGLGTSLGAATVAEGVETPEQLAALRAEGFVEVQGFLFSAARPAADLPGLMNDLPGRARAAA